MSNIVVSPKAKRDLVETGDYISFKLQNRSAAHKLLDRIQKSVMSLSRFPESGTPVKLSGAGCAYRYLVCGNYMIFYHLSEETVFVDRILYGRRDYLSILFRDELADDNE